MTIRPQYLLIGLVSLALVAAAGLTGCGEDGSPTSATLDPGADFQVADPLDGVLNSTEGTTPTDHGPRIDRLADRLGLTEDQKIALAAAYEAFHDAIADLRDQVRAGDLTRDEAREQATILREAFEAELQLILTPEQWDLLQEMRENRDGRERGHRDRGDRWESWLEEIGADEAQTAAVLEALETMREGMFDLREQVREGTLDPEIAREMAMELRDAFDAALQEILTAEQYAALLELRPDYDGDHQGDGDHGNHGNDDDGDGQHGHDDGGNGHHGDDGDDDDDHGGGHGGGGHGNQ